MKDINKKTFLPIILSIFTTIPSYWLSKLFVDFNNVKFVSTTIDDIIPLYTPAVIIYVLAYLQWIIAIYILLKQDTLLGKRIALTFIISSIFDFLIYITYPTLILRPNIEVNNIFDWILSIVYSIDTPINVCPSFHCFGSTLAIIALNNSKNINRKYKIINVIFSIFVYISTLLTKQHYFIDVPAGIMLAYVCYFISFLLIKE